MAYNTNLYPSEVIENPSAPYVYFNSLPDDIIDQVLPYFQQNIEDISRNDTGVSAIDQAFSFLQAVITTERAKEEAFVQYLKDRTKETIQLEIPDIDSDWSQFVRDMQTLIDFGNTGIRDLQNEYSRCGTTVKREQAKKPFSTLRQVSFIFACPLSYAIAVSNTATTIPVMNNIHPML